MTGSLSQLAMLALQVAVVAAVLLFLFHRRGRWGLSPLYIAIGSFQYLQVLLAMTVYVEILPGIVVSPGSVVLFTSTMFVVLLVYLREDADRTRHLVYGLLIANVLLTLLSSLFGLQIASATARNVYDIPLEIFQRDLRFMLVGTLSFVVDVLLVMVVYEGLSKLLRGALFVRLWASLLIVLAFDSIFFITANFLGDPNYGQLLLSSFIGKAIAATLFAGIGTGYLYFAREQREDDPTEIGTGDFFDVLSYRQKYERVRERAVRDPLTGVFNRWFFDEVLPLELARSRRSDRPTTLMLLDLDDFKRINDEQGHQEGDRVLKAVADALQETMREADAPCRIGGDEFAVILPHADLEASSILGHRILQRLEDHCRLDPRMASYGVRVTIGIAEFPAEARTSKELIRLADRRLYRGKRTGSGRVVAEGGGDGRTPLPPTRVAPDGGARVL